MKSTGTMQEIEYLRNVRKWVEQHDSRPMTWGHVVLASLDVAMEKSQYREAPLLRNLRAGLRNEALSRIEPDMRGLGENDFAEGVRQLRILRAGTLDEGRASGSVPPVPLRQADWTRGLDVADLAQDP